MCEPNPGSDARGKIIHLPAIRFGNERRRTRPFLLPAAAHYGQHLTCSIVQTAVRFRFRGLADTQIY